MADLDMLHHSSMDTMRSVYEMREELEMTDDEIGQGPYLWVPTQTGPPKFATQKANRHFIKKGCERDKHIQK